MSEAVTSQIQKHFLINSVYRRSRRYFDIPRLNQLEHQLEVKRRMPQSTKQTIDSRVSGSFVCSNDLLLDKVSHDLSYFHSKAQAEEADEIETTYTTRTKKPKTVDMKKMLARSQVNKEKVKHLNQEQFKNFSLTTHKPRRSLDFDCYLNRDTQASKTSRYDNPEIEASPGEKIGKLYEKCLFDQSHLRCFVDYQKNSKDEPKINQEQYPIYDPSKVKRGENFTKKNMGQLGQFYHGKGKQDPSQFDNRLLKDNEYFWRGVREQRQRFKDFSVQKRKEDQILRRLAKILQKKKPEDDRNEMCDEKYFRRNPAF